MIDCKRISEHKNKTMDKTECYKTRYLQFYMYIYILLPFFKKRKLNNKSVFEILSSKKQLVNKLLDINPVKIHFS